MNCYVATKNINTIKKGSLWHIKEDDRPVTKRHSTGKYILVPFIEAETKITGNCYSNNSYKTPIDVFRYFKNEAGLKDVSSVYEKIEKLFDKLKSEGTRYEIITINDIRLKYQKGYYPSKSEFAEMNKVWNKIN